MRKCHLGGHWPRKGVWGCAALKTPFRASPVVRKGPISNKRVSSQDPLLRKFGNFSLYSLKFCPNFSYQASKFRNFQLTSPQILKFSVHKPLNFEIFSSHTSSFRSKYQFTSPTLRKSRPHTPTWKKVECLPPTPPPPVCHLITSRYQMFLACKYSPTVGSAKGATIFFRIGGS